MKRITVLVSLIAVLASSATAVADVSPHWYVGWQFVTVPVSVTAKGKPKGRSAPKLTFDLTRSGARVNCLVTFQDVISNPSDRHGPAGTDEMTAFGLTRCTQESGTSVCSGPVEVVALGLPWRSHLIFAAPGVRDVIEGVGFDFRCGGGQRIGSFTGTLSPIFNDVTKPGKACQPTNPRPCAQLEYQAEPLLDGSGGTVTVTAVHKLRTTVEVK
jgi:hypothetical protein